MIDESKWTPIRLKLLSRRKTARLLARDTPSEVMNVVRARRSNLGIIIHDLAGAVEQAEEAVFVKKTELAERRTELVMLEAWCKAHDDGGLGPAALRFLWTHGEGSHG